MNRKLNSISMVSFIVHGMIGLRLMILAQTTAKYAKNDAWISIILLGVIVLIVALIVFSICEQYPGLNFAEINEKALGKVFGKAGLMIIVVYNIFIGGLSIRYFAEGINTFLLEVTPRWVIISTFLLVIYYCMKRDIKTISIIFDILLPLVLFFIIIFMLLSLTAIEPKNILPILSNGPIPVIKGSLNAINILVPVLIFSFILPYFNNPKETKRYIIWGIIISTIVSVVIVIVCIMVFGEKEILHFTFPTIMLGKSIKLESQILERAETFFMAAWIPITFTSAMVYYISTTLSIKQFFNTKKNDLIIAIQIPLLFIAASLPKSLAEIPRLVGISNTIVIIWSITYFPILLLAVFIKKKGGKNKERKV